MNGYQRLWWQQAQSDHAVLVLLRQRSAAPCHQLHYLQMVTEKLAKAYIWRSGNKPPPRSHIGFAAFLRRLGDVGASERQQIAGVLGFARFKDFQNWIPAVMPLAHQLENLAPTLAQDGPNPEYPWPHTAPKHAPATFKFDVWTQLTGTGRGRQLIRIIDVAVDKFPAYG